MLVRDICKKCREQLGLTEEMRGWNDIDEKLWQIGYVICLADRFVLNKKNRLGDVYRYKDIKSIYSDCPLMHMEHMILSQKELGKEKVG